MTILKLETWLDRQRVLVHLDTEINFSSSQIMVWCWEIFL